MLMDLMFYNARLRATKTHRYRRRLTTRFGTVKRLGFSQKHLQ